MPPTSSASPVEHFVTLFDSGFLPMGMALHRSLLAHAQPFHLWVVCVDEAVESQLRALALPHLTPMPLREVETAALLAVKPGRSRMEYCWTLKSFTPHAVFRRVPDAARVTYVEADLFFFDDPRILLQELDQSGKQALITEHAYAPEYDRATESGRFCAQFMTFRNTPQSARIVDRWQRQCLEWCFARHEGGKFGDQKYLDEWPTLFASEVHVVTQTSRTLAPWNAAFFLARERSGWRPVFYHFHQLRIVSRHMVRFCRGYRIGSRAMKLYREYQGILKENVEVLESRGMSVPVEGGRWALLKHLKRVFTHRVILGYL